LYPKVIDLIQINIDRDTKHWTQCTKCLLELAD
jgi:hypothetical protein